MGRAARARREAAKVPTVRNQTTSTLYEGAAQTRRTLGWRAPTSTPNVAILANLTTLRDRSRAAVRNDGFAKAVIDKLVANLVGTGITPLCQVADPVYRKQVHELWLRWTDESDADGLLDFYGQQAQATRGWLEGGECFLRMRPRLPVDGLSVPLQVQIIEPEYCPHDWSTLAPNGNKIRAGIEFDPIGRRVAYWFYQSRPGDLQEIDYSQLRRVPADAVVHLYDPLRPGQLRGTPHLTQALIKLFEFDKFDDATLLRQQLANLFAAFITRTQSGSEGLDPLTGLAPASGDTPTLSLEPGIFQQLEPGEDVKFSTPPGTGDGYKDFMRQQLLGVSAATGVPYELLTGDMSGLNDRVVRVIVNEFRTRISAWQYQILAFQLCRKTWNAWLDRAWLSGALPRPTGDAATGYAVKWMTPRQPYIHPVQDVQSQKDAIRSGFTTRSAVVAEYGEDAEALDAEQQADNTRADDLGLRYDSDGRFAQKGGAAGTSAEGEANPTTGAPAQAAVALKIETRPGAARLVRDADGRITGFESGN